MSDDNSDKAKRMKIDSSPDGREEDMFEENSSSNNTNPETDFNTDNEIDNFNAEMENFNAEFDNITNFHTELDNFNPCFENFSTTTEESTFFSNVTEFEAEAEAEVEVEPEASTSSKGNTEADAASVRAQSSIDTEVESDRSNDVATTSNDSGAAFFRVRTRRNRHYRIQSSESENASEIERVLEDDLEERLTGRRLPADSFFDFSPNSSEAADSDHDTEFHPILKKTKPKHKWFLVPDLLNRERGSGSKYNAPELFRQRCHGSLHSVKRLELLHKLKKHSGCVNSLNFSPDGKLLVSGSDDLLVCVWNWTQGKCLMSYPSQHVNNVFQTKFLHLSGDLHIATSSRDGQIRLSQVSNDGDVRSNRKLGEHKGPCHKIAVVVDQPHLVLSAGEDGCVYNHDVRDKKSAKLVTVRNDLREVALYSVNTHPLNTYEFCVCGRMETVHVYDQRKTNRPLHIYNPYNESSGMHVTSAVYNHDGSEILASYNDGDIFLFEEKTRPGHFIHQYQGHRNSATIKGVNFFGPKSEYVVSGSDCGHFFFWDKNLESIVRWILADYNGVVNCLEPHPRVPFLCTSGLDWDIKVWSPSFFEEPTMSGLAHVVKENERLRNEILRHSDSSGVDGELWMLWSSSSSSNPSPSTSTPNSHSHEDSEMEEPQGCSPS